MSSCLPTASAGSGRGLRIDLDMIKSSSSPPTIHPSPLRSISSAASTVSEASNSSSSSAATALSLKRSRTPRKRPNQTYKEAAALLAAIYPSVFPAKKKSPKLTNTTKLQFVSDLLETEEDILLPPLPVLGDIPYLIRDAPPNRTVIETKPASPAVTSQFREPASPASFSSNAVYSPSNEECSAILDDDDDGFDAESMLDEEGVGSEGIDSIMGNLSMDSGGSEKDATEESVLANCSISPYLRSLMVVGFQHASNNISQAFKRRDDDGAWWLCPAVPVTEITPKCNNSNTLVTLPEKKPAKKKKKKKSVLKLDKIEKKVKGEAVVDAQASDSATANAASEDSGKKSNEKARLGLKLDHEEVLNAWSDRGSMFAEGGSPDSPKSSAEILAKLADIDLFPENGAGGGVREASVMRYKEKRRSRLYSKKIRYQVRKVNAECRPRMKGRFVRSLSLFQQALGEEES